MRRSPQLHVDDLETNFAMNPANGLKIVAFSAVLREAKIDNGSIGKRFCVSCSGGVAVAMLPIVCLLVGRWLSLADASTVLKRGQVG